MTVSENPQPKYKSHTLNWIHKKGYVSCIHDVLRSAIFSQDLLKRNFYRNLGRA